MLSKHLTNVIQNLEKKKFREKYNLYKVEGDKLVQELLLSDMKIDSLIARPSWIESNQQHLKKCNTIEVNEIEMGRISNFKSLPEVIALAEIPVRTYNPDEIKDSLSVVLNGIQDPGNIGTILRVCDWFGIQNIFCDHDCANIFNPKSVQASMGAIFRVNVFYLDLVDFIPRFTNSDFPCYGTFLEGENIYRMQQGIYRHGKRRKRDYRRNRTTGEPQNNDSQLCTQSLFDRIPERGRCHWYHPFGIQTNRIYK